MIKLQEDGKGYSTLTSIRGVVKPAFQIAYNNEIGRESNWKNNTKYRNIKICEGKYEKL